MRKALMPFQLLVLVAVVSSTGCDAEGAQEWTQLGLDGGGVMAVAQTPWGLFAGTQFDGVQRLDPARGTFERLALDHAAVSSLLFVGGPPPRLFAGLWPMRAGPATTDAAVFVSTDSGRTWMPADGGLAATDESNFWASSLAVDPTNPQVMFFGEQFPNILRSVDGGQTWDFVSGKLTAFGGRMTRIVVDERTPGRVWVSGYDAFGVGVIKRSDDSGSTWEDVRPFPNVEVGVSDIALDPVIHGRIWAAIGGTVFRSDDEAQTWDESLSGALSGLPVTLIFSGRDLFAVGTVFGDAQQRSETEQLVVLRLRSGDFEWERLSVPDGVKGGLSATFDDGGRLVVGTAGSGVWRLER